MNWLSFEKWNRRFPTFGHLSLSAFIFAIISGIPLAIPFDIGHAFDSIQRFTLLSSAAGFYRAAHYWSSQLFVVFTIIHVIEHYAKANEKSLKSGVWVRLCVALPVTLFLMLTGFILKADSEGVLASQVLGGLLASIPLLGESLRRFLLSSSGDAQVIYAHHLATATIYLLIIIVEHARRIWPEALSLVYALSVSVILAIILPPELKLESAASVKGPWYFVGLREILSWIPSPFLVVTLVILIFLLFMAVRWLSPAASKRVKIGLGVVFVIYCLLSVLNWFFRDNNWNLVFG